MASADKPLASPEEVLAFWREAGPDRWVEKDATFDDSVRERFLATYEAAARGGPSCAAWAAARTATRSSAAERQRRKRPFSTRGDLPDEFRRRLPLSGLADRGEWPRQDRRARAPC